MNVKVFLHILFICAICLVLLGQHYKIDRLSIALEDGNSVSLCKVNALKESDKTLYAYLPVNFRVPGEDSNKEYSLIFFDTNDDGTTDQALMHLMLTWGLTERQCNEAENILLEIDSTAIMMGSVPLQPAQADFAISKHTELGRILNRSLTVAGGLPLMPGAKMAMSFMVNEKDTDRLKTLITQEKELKNTFLQLQYAPYPTNQYTVNKDELLFKISFQQIFKE